MPQQFPVGGFMGLGFENTYGTAVSRTAFHSFITLDITRSHDEKPTPTSRAPTPEDASLGNYDPRFKFNVEARPEAIGELLKAFHGASSVTSAQQGGTAAYKHTFDHKDAVQPVTVEKRMGTLNKSTVLDGGVVTELTFQYENNMMVLGGQGLGRKDTIDNAPTVATYNTKRPFMWHDLTATLGGVTTGVKKVGLTFTRKVTEDDYESGSRYRKGSDGASFEVKYTAELLFKDLALLKRSLGGASATTPQDDPLYQADNFKWTSSENAGAGFPYVLEVDFTRGWWKAIGTAWKANDGVTQRVEGMALYDAAASPARSWRAFLTNTKTSY